jgi:AraC-like DNA-binding protein
VAARSSVSRFDDPYAFQAAVKPAQVEILVTAKGDFDAGLNRIVFPRLWAQRGHENLPRIANSSVSLDRPPVFFLTDSDQASIRHCGRDLAFGELVVAGPGSTHYHQTSGPCRWTTLSLTRKDLSAASTALVGVNLALPSLSHRLRPPRTLMSRLLNLHRAAETLAAHAPDVLAQPEAARALEHAFVHAMIMCLSESTPVKRTEAALRHTIIIARFEELLAANYAQPLHLAEMCAAIGVSERTLRISCIEQLGMGPIRYLWLRRMHLVHSVLIQTAPGSATVTRIATDNGFWEMGRFAVEYGALFGEAPSVTLRRPAEERRKAPNNPFAFADSEYVQTLTHQQPTSRCNAGASKIDAPNATFAPPTSPETAAPITECRGISQVSSGGSPWRHRLRRGKMTLV